jgi:histidine phosphotransferase ChpT
MNDSFLIAEILCTRLCHDITGPIGAVNNGAEFLEEENFNMNEDALKLITDSAREAVSRLQFFRQSYGVIKDSGDVPLSDKKDLVDAFLRQTRVKLDWPDTHTDASGVGISQGMAKLLLNMVVLVTGSLIKGGTLSVRIEKSGVDGKQVRVRGEGDSIKADEQIVAALRNLLPMDQLSPKNVQAVFSQRMAEHLGITLSLDYSPSHFELIARK